MKKIAVTYVTFFAVFSVSYLPGYRYLSGRNLNCICDREAGHPAEHWRAELLLVFPAKWRYNDSTAMVSDPGQRKAGNGRNALFGGGS